MYLKTGLRKCLREPVTYLPGYPVNEPALPGNCISQQKQSGRKPGAIFTRYTQLFLIQFPATEIINSTLCEIMRGNSYRNSTFSRIDADSAGTGDLPSPGGNTF